MQNSYHPQWVLEGEELQHVSTFAELKPHERPLVICPVCRQSVTLKLGAIRAHHFAHQPDSNCSLTNPETALHFNMKYYLFYQLRKTSEILISQRCSSSGCHESRNVRWLGKWDKVEVEYSLANYRPDIALIKEDMVIGAIEVFVTHRVDVDKSAFYDTKFIHWLELEAKEEKYLGETAWQPSQPLDYIKLGQSLPSWTCDACIKRNAERAEAWKTIQEQEEYQRKNKTETVEAMMVDFYYPSGKQLRHVFYMRDVMSDGIWCEAYVVAIMGKDTETVAKIKAAALEYSHTEELKSKVDSFIERKQKRTAAITDIVAPWRKWQQGNKFHPDDHFGFPFKYRWNEKKGIWVLLSKRNIDF